MKKSAWISGGVLFVTVVFFIPEQAGSLWASVIFGTVAALAYLLIFAGSWLKEITSRGKRRTITVTLAVLGLTTIASLLLWSHQSEWQRDLLTEIRSTIEKGLATQLINEPLFQTFRDYYRSPEVDPDMERLFRSRYHARIGAGNELEFGSLGKDHTLHLYLETAVSDTIMIVGESGYLAGRDPTFQNHSGKSGLYQVQGTVTREGVRYERVN